jgi:iron complex outermembrane receptor protein
MKKMAIGLSAALCAPLLVAQEAPPALEEIVVSARKVQENLQDVPVAITAVTASQIEALSLNRLNEIAQFAPNVNAAPLIASSATLQLAIRGMLTSMDLERSFDPGVGVAVDGVYTANNVTGDLAMFDIASVEILRGPQGTLHGRNNIGGAILINRNQANLEDGLSGEFELGYGNYDEKVVRGAVNVPVNDAFALRFSGQYRKRDGLAENQTPGFDDMEAIDKSSFRIGGFWLIDENQSLTLNYDHTRDRGSPGANRNVTRPEGWWNGTGYSPFTYCLAGDLATGGNNGNNCTSKEPTGDALWKIENDFENLFKIDGDFFMATYVWDINQDHQLTAIGSYGEVDEKTGFDWDGATDPYTFQAIGGGLAPGTFYHTPIRDQHEESGSVELRLSGNLSERLTYVAGLYYFNSEYTLYADNFAFGDYIFNIQNTNHDSTSYAAFGELKWDINDHWRVNAGVRWTQDEKDFTHSMYDDINASFIVSCDKGYTTDEVSCALAEQGVFPDVVNVDVDTDDDWSEVTPRVGVDYIINDQMMSYLSVTTGYKAGGFNGRAANDETALDSFDPETVVSYELGFKSTFWDDRARLNIAVFFADYDDMQTEINVPIEEGSGQQPIILNVGKSESKGVEVEFLVVPLPDTKIMINYGYLDAEFTELDANLFGETDANGELIIYDYSGNKLRRAPENQYSITLDQGFDSGIGQFNWVLAYNWTDSMHMTVDNDPYHEQDSIGLLTTSLTLRSQNDNWRASVWGKNLTEEEGIGYGLRVADVFEIASPIAEPRTYGVTVNYSF